MTDNLQLGVLLFGVFLVIYIVTVLGNLSLVLLIRVSPRPHTPMYLFLSSLSFLDVCFSSITTPKTLANLLSKLQAVSFLGCITQMALFIIFASAECNLLASMAYDRYTAICHPLLYHIKMSKGHCLLLVAGSYRGGLNNMISVTTSIAQLSFCQPRIISHFFCDIPPLLALACSDPWVTQLLVVGCGGFTLVTSIVVILVSYIYVLMTILGIPSVSGKQKAFSTCASHLIAIGLYYGTTMYTYLQPSQHGSQAGNQMVSVFYTMVIPMLNPLIYSLRNQEVAKKLSEPCSPGSARHLQALRPQPQPQAHWGGLPQAALGAGLLQLFWAGYPSPASSRRWSSEQHWALGSLLKRPAERGLGLFGLSPATAARPQITGLSRGAAIRGGERSAKGARGQALLAPKAEQQSPAGSGFPVSSKRRIAPVGGYQNWPWPTCCFLTLDARSRSCLTQQAFGYVLGTDEIRQHLVNHRALLLAAVSPDDYITICDPLFSFVTSLRDAVGIWVCLGTHKKMEVSVVKVKTCSGSVGANSSKWSEFFLMGLTKDPQLQPILFVLFFFIYAFTVVGNLGLLTLITSAFFVVSAVTEFFLLASMAYDRYVAVCKPLLYHVIMSP
ncbi:Olfactory receptor 1052 [Galemys pyrenaicus]|uniref:Olfactory receptor 1052 n=1 Tax=Galemys pyrenaicus TaxID=202257 RepID=A0A8J6AX17_GALPY|nr:Olfactory receptor 1052 [Galemys pyrenaicus]